jgi:putative ABC transport system substrate-binding protein
MSKNVTGLALCAWLFGLCSFAEAQQSRKVPRIGYLLEGSASGGATLLEAFRQGLRDLGYIEGKNIFIEPRWGESRDERLPALTAELVRLNVDVIVAAPTPPALAAYRATKSIPIVVAHMSDPVETGLVTSLARPGGNVTGMRSLTAELGGKRLELLKEAFPHISRVAVLRGREDPTPGTRRQLRDLHAAAEALGLELQPVLMGYPERDFRKLFVNITEMRATALTTISSLRRLDDPVAIVEVAAKARLPAIYPQRDFVEAGGLMSYSAKWEDFHRRAAYYVDKILKGAKPADLPVEQPMKFELVINLKTAKALDLTIPPAVLMEADKVIK